MERVKPEEALLDSVPRCEGVYRLIPCARTMFDPRPLACEVLHSYG